MNGLRRMESSGSRDSTTGALTATLDVLLAAAVAAAVIVAMAGVDAQIFGMTVRAHGAGRVLILASLLLGVRVWRGVRPMSAWLTRMILLVAVAASVATWLRFLLTTIGGADSWGYVSASELIRHGRLIDPAPMAQWLSASNRLAIASPLGWAPAPGEAGIAPAYPLGLPIVMALFGALGGSNAVFFVSPIAAAIVLLLVYRLARQWYDGSVALLAVALVAWNPVFIAYAKQPMSDMVATMWVMLALWLATLTSGASGLLAGLAAGSAIMTRPALLLVGGVIPLASYRADTPRSRVFATAAGVALVVVIQMAIQQLLFGSPFSTGYGSGAGLFAIDHLGTNARIYLSHGWQVVGVLWLPALVLGLMAARPDPRWKPAAIFGAVTLPYLFYLPFDHWETLRFLLPGLVPLTIIAASGLALVARLQKMSWVSTAVVTAVMVITIVPAERLLRASSAWEISAIEARYPLAGEWINVNTPASSVVLANQHSGSLRWYGKRHTLRWDFIAPEQLVTTVRELQAHGAPVYVALEGDEVQMFNTRFAGVIDQLTVDPVGRIRNVSFLRLQ